MVCFLLLLVAATSAPAAAEPFRLRGGHAAYAVGGSTDDGVRHAIDVGVTGGWLTETASQDGLPSELEGPIVGASLASGLGASPTYLAVEGGLAYSTGFAAGSASLALVTRVHPDLAAGLGLHLTGDLVGFQLGLRLAVVGIETEAVAMVTLGFGRF